MWQRCFRLNSTRRSPCASGSLKQRSFAPIHCPPTFSRLSSQSNRFLVSPSLPHFKSRTLLPPISSQPCSSVSQRRLASSNNEPTGGPASSMPVTSESDARLNLGRLLPVGFLGGFLGACTGLGGAIVIIPGLSSFTSLSPHKILGTSTLVCATLACSVGALSFLAQGYVDFGLAAIIAGSGAATAFVGARVSDFVNGRALQRLTGAFLLLIVPSVLQEREHQDDQAQDENVTVVEHEARKPFSNAGSWSDISLETHLPYIVAGGIGGFLQGLLGIGSGIVPMAYLSSKWCDIDQHVAVGTTFAATVPMGLAGSVAHFRRNNIHPRAAFWLSMATLSAMFIGSQFVANVDEHTLRQIFAGLLAVSAVRMIMN